MIPLSPSLVGTLYGGQGPSAILYREHHQALRAVADAARPCVEKRASTSNTEWASLRAALAAAKGWEQGPTTIDPAPAIEAFWLHEVADTARRLMSSLNHLHLAGALGSTWEQRVQEALDELNAALSGLDTQGAPCIQR